MFPAPDEGKPPPGGIIAAAKLTAKSKAVRLTLPSWSATTNYHLHGALVNTDCGPHHDTGRTVLLSGHVMTNGKGLAELTLNNTMQCGDGTIQDKLIIDDVTFVATAISEKPAFTSYTIAYQEATQYGGPGVLDPAVMAKVTVHTWKPDGEPFPLLWVSWHALVQNPGAGPLGGGG